MQDNCNCNYCKQNVNEYFCITCGYNFNECESKFKCEGFVFCPKCVSTATNKRKKWQHYKKIRKLSKKVSNDKQ